MATGHPSIKTTSLTFGHRVAHDEVGAGWEGVHRAGVHHHLVGLLLAVHGVAGRHRIVVLVSSARLVKDSTFFYPDAAQRPPLQPALQLPDSHLQDEDLGLPHQALALVPFEHRCDILDADLPVVGVDVVVLSVAQEGQQEAVHVRVVLHRRWERGAIVMSGVLSTVPVPGPPYTTLQIMCSQRDTHARLFEHVHKYFVQFMFVLQKNLWQSAQFLEKQAESCCSNNICDKKQKKNEFYNVLRCD